MHVCMYVNLGLGGSPLLLESGGPPYLLPLVQRDKLYNVKDLCQKAMGGSGKILAGKQKKIKFLQKGIKEVFKSKSIIFVVGAGAGPYPLRNSNCEGIYNMSISVEGEINNGSYTAKISGKDESCVLEPIPNSEPRCALLLNLFVCRGEPGQVIKISCKKRTGHMNFIECIRLGLLEKYQKNCVGM